jgi:peptidyl-prolyl cis-trans isomerase C
VADAEIEAQLAQVKGGFPSEQAFLAALAERQMTLDKLRLDIRQQMQAMKLVEAEIGPTVEVTDVEVTDFYTKNPEKFQEPESVHASHILIRTPDATDEAQKKKARAEAQSVLAELKKGGDFAALAKEHSQDASSAARGGDLGLIVRGKTAPAFEQAAFALRQPGELSEVVRTDFGYHIIKLDERMPARRQSFESVRESILKGFADAELKSSRQQVIDKAIAEVELNQSALEAIVAARDGAGTAR